MSGTSPVVCDDALWPISYQLVQLTAKSISRPAIHGEHKQRWKAIYVTFEHKHHINACRCRAVLYHIYYKQNKMASPAVPKGPCPRCVTKINMFILVSLHHPLMSSQGHTAALSRSVSMMADGRK